MPTLRPSGWAFAAALVLLLATLCPGSGGAATAAQVPAPAAAAPPTTSAAPSIDELQRLVGTLQDTKARAALVSELQALIAAQRGLAAKPATAAPAFLSWLSARLDQVTGEVLQGAAVVVEAPMLADWTRQQVTDRAARHRWAAIGLALAVVFGCAGIVEWLLRRILRRVLARGPARRHDSWSVRAVFAIVNLVLETLPALAFAGVALLVLPFTMTPFTTARITLTLLVQAVVAVWLILGVSRAVLLPTSSTAGLVAATEATRRYLYVWVRRFVVWAVFGRTLGLCAWWLGVPGGISGLLMKVVGLVLAGLAITFIVHNRGAVGAWIAGPAVAPDARGWRRLRRRVGETWHLPAMVYVAGIFVVYALHIEGGFAYILRATALSALILAGARLVIGFARRAGAGGLAVAPDWQTRYPLLESRANRYVPMAVGLVTIIAYALAILAMLQVWSIDAFAWFDSAWGHRLAGSALTIATVIVVALAGWEIFAAMIERHLSGMAAGNAPSRARRRTLLPLLRTAMLCVVVVMATLVVLSQLGLDIAPLLAGAGVVGLAIGFGSQALVKDIITGLFILIEDQIAVGDIVDVGKDHAGIVEAISIRTIRLRDQSGVVHTVPFGEVTSVKNLSRDFAYAVSRITVSYAEDIDRVVEILREAATELAADKEIGPLILDPFDYRGVDSLDDYTVVLLLRIRTLPGQHYTVIRAFNRLVKIAFDKHKIASRDPWAMTVGGAAAPPPPTAPPAPV